MNTELLDQYLALRKQRDELEERIDALRPSIIDMLHETRDTYMYNSWTFITQQSISWSFSERVEKLQSQLSQLKHDEKSSGIAKIKSKTDMLIVRPLHDKPEAKGNFEELRKKYPRAYEKWTPEEDDFLRKEFLQGQSIETLAQSLQRKTGGIKARLVKHGLIQE